MSPRSSAPIVSNPANPAIVVIKIGSASLVDAHGRLDWPFLDKISAQVRLAVDKKFRPVIVTSGAVASGEGILGLSKRPETLPERQALAAIGQATLMHHWQGALGKVGLRCAQVLLTSDDFTHRLRYLNLTATFHALFAYDVVPVINENDTVAVEELTVGDNDRLSALVASQLSAAQLFLLTDIDGLYDANPRQHAHAQLIPLIEQITPQIRAVAGAGGKLGRGGMASKIEAARIASGAGVHTVIAKAREPHVITRLLAGEPVGTRVQAAPAKGRIDSRRRWLALARRASGTLHVDAGAVRALVLGGKSLLPAGITQADGEFDAGDTVRVLGPDGIEIARGLVSFDANSLRAVVGQKLHAAAKTLGTAVPNAAIHRDNLLLSQRDLAAKHP